ncbi:protein SRC2 homolog [Juglans regia]|uniref:Protein SRC2 homolog n=1 Tax=Juglans regia TaxID=51240 RepID=A0A2I4H1M1_JUGRE|nr:protein SRC2 homolog [Juglans regia]
MECRTLDLVIKSAKDLKDVNLFSKMDVYAVVKIDGDHNLKSSKHKTPTDKDCGTSPKWNFPVQFTVDNAAAQQNRLTLVVKIKSDRSLGDKEIGKVNVPIKELLDVFGEAKEAKNVSYSVTTPSGKVKGTLDLSYKFGEKFTAPEQHKNKHAEPAPAYPAGYAAGSSVAAAYPPPGAYPPPAYAHPPPPGGYPPPAGAYPPPQPGAYPPVAAGYGGYPPGGYPQYPQYPPQGGYPPQTGYGYGGYPAPVQQPQKSKMGGVGGMALGAGAGLLGGLIIGDMISDATDGGFDDGGFDF